MDLEVDKNIAGRRQKSACASSRDAIQRGLLHSADHKVEVVAADRLVPHRANARTHSRKQVRQIAESLARFGFCNPVLIDDANTVIAGHGRLQAARLLGLTAVPTLRLSHLSDAEKRAFVIADNRLAEKAGWDREILAIELQGLIDLDFDVELTGFAMGEIDILLNDADEARRESAGPEDKIPEPTSGPTVTRSDLAVFATVSSPWPVAR
jgi:ParB-like chromosome segregation protein Spo0J